MVSSEFLKILVTGFSQGGVVPFFRSGMMSISLLCKATEYKSKFVPCGICLRSTLALFALGLESGRGGLFFL